MAVSQRSIEGNKRIGRGFVDDHIESSLTDLFHPQSNPEGYIALSIAENQLVRPFLPPVGLLDITEAGPYTSPRGTPWIREELAAFLSREICHCAVDAAHLTVSSGAVAVLDLLIHTVCDEGEGVLLPAPYFPGFEPLIKSRNRCQVVPVPFDPFEADMSIDPGVLQKCYEESEAKGVDVKALLISSPQNPTGHVFSAEALQTCVQWTKNNGVHLICDEAYGGSVFDHAKPFASIGPHVCESVHMIWTTSKDLGLSGLRVGVVYTKNKFFNERVNAHIFESSVLAQISLRRILEQQEGISRALESSREQLRDICARVCDALKVNGIRHVRPSGGLFILLNSKNRANRSAVDPIDNLDQVDDVDYLDILHRTNTTVTPSYAMGLPRHSGWFRICFSYNDQATTLVAMRRITSCLSSSQSIR